MRRHLATCVLIAAVAMIAWAVLLAISGGFETAVFGLSIHAHNPRKPALLGLVALALLVVTYGPRQTADLAVHGARVSNQWLARLTIPYRLLALALTLAMLIFVWRFSSCVAGGSDSYGYLSQAQFWLHGVPIVPQPLAADVPWPNATLTLAPLGYRPVPGAAAIVPTYAVGLPLFLAGVQWVAGYAAIFWTWPIAGATLVLASFGLGRALGSPAAGLIAAWFMATDVTLLTEVTSPMSDVPLAAALAVTCYFLFRAQGPAPVRAGLAAAIAVLVRPNLAGTVAAMAVWLALQPLVGSRTSWSTALRRAAIFLGMVAPAVATIALANRALYGSPLLSGYGGLAHIYSWHNVTINLHRYPALVSGTQAQLLFAGMIAVCLPLRWLWRGVEDRSVFAGIALFIGSVLVQYFAFEPATNAGYLRYVLPCWPLLMVGVARLILILSAPGWRAAAVAALVIFLGVRSLVAADHAYAFDLRGERKYTQAAAILRDHAEPNSVVLAMQHSGSVRYYTGLTTLRYDILGPQWLDAAVTWFNARGVHVYAVLDSWEVPIFRERFAGQERAAAFASPAFTYQGEVTTHVFDVSAPLAGRASPVIVNDTFADRRIVPPAPPQK